MSKAISAGMRVESEPKSEEVRLLDERLHEFNVQATGTSDAKLFAVFLRDGDQVAVGGIFGWTWGATCYIRSLYVPAHLRNQGFGSALMSAVETEARARGCGQIVLETHEFQAPDFYSRLGFEIIGRVDEYPRGHQYLTMRKRLTA
jgi:ribosomal protein S18 acetylase RimI-like enzyme